MTDIKKNGNNKEKNSQDKKPPKSSKLLELLKQAKENKQQPDQVANGKKAILGKKIKKLSKDHTYPDSLKNASATALFGEKLSDKKSIPESDIEIIINNIDWDKLKKSCADFYVNVTRNNPFKIYLRIIKNRIYYNSEILVKYINNIGFWKEEKLEIKHGIMYHSLGIVKLYLKNNIIHKLTTEGRIVTKKIVEEVERITYPKILLYLNTFTYCEVTKRINHAKKGDLGKNVKEERNLEDLKNIVEEWFSENRYNIPCDTECLSSLNLLNEADSGRRKTSETVKDDNLETKEFGKGEEPTGKRQIIIETIKDIIGTGLKEYRNKNLSWADIHLTFSTNFDKITVNQKHSYDPYKDFHFPQKKKRVGNINLYQFFIQILIGSKHLKYRKMIPNERVYLLQINNILKKSFNNTERPIQRKNENYIVKFDHDFENKISKRIGDSSFEELEEKQIL